MKLVNLQIYIWIIALKYKYSLTLRYITFVVGIDKSSVSRILARYNTYQSLSTKKRGKYRKT